MCYVFYMTSFYGGVWNICSQDKDVEVLQVAYVRLT